MPIDSELEAQKAEVKEMKEEVENINQLSVDSELKALKEHVKQVEEEVEKINQFPTDVDDQTAGCATIPAIVPLSLEERQEIDTRSVYVGNVDYGSIAEELESHFHGCGTINRVTILCQRDGHPKGFAYIEFAEKESVETALAMSQSLFRGRQIRVMPKRTNLPRMSTTYRYPRGGFRGQEARTSYPFDYPFTRGSRHSRSGYGGRRFFYAPY